MGNDSDDSNVNFELIPVSNISLIPIYHYGRNLSLECPNNLGFFKYEIAVKFLTNGYLYTDNGSVAEIFTNGFCLERFSQPNVSQELYLSVVMCRDAKPIQTFSSNQKHFIQRDNPCGHSLFLDDFYEKLRAVYTVCGIVSTVFLALTLFLYLTLPGLSKKIAGEI